MALNFKTDSVLTGAEPAPAAKPLPPETIAPHFPQLEILECLGRGGMAALFRLQRAFWTDWGRVHRRLLRPVPD